MAAKDNTFSNNIHDSKLPHDTHSLEKIAHSIESDIVVWEGGFFVPAALLVLGLGLAVTAYENFVKGNMTIVAIFLAFSFLLLFIFIKTLLRRRQPYMTFTKDGLVSSVFKTPVSWRGIEDFQINSAKTNAFNIAVGMEFVITPSYLPEQNEKSRSGSYYDKKTKKLMISGFNFRLDTNRDAIIEQIHKYRNAAIAKHRLYINQSAKK